MSAERKLPGKEIPPRRFFPYVSVVTLLFAIYFVAGKLGLKLAFVNASATAVWPPTGIALAAFVMLGYRVWPGILLGAFLVNLTTAGSIATSIGIAVGNTLEGLIGAYFVNRLAKGRRAFDRPQDVFKFAVLAGIVSTMVSATFGVASLSLGGFASWSQYRSVWLTWWLGDATGALTVAPPLVLWTLNPRVRWNPARYFEAVVLLLSLCFLGLIAFGDLFGLGAKNYPLEFICIPLVVWAAFRFGQREAATISFLLSGIAIWGTLRGFGPFVLKSANDSLLLLQAFMGLVAVMAVSLAAVISERKQAEQALGTNEGQLRLFVEHSPAAIAMFDRGMRYLIASRRWLSDYGVRDVVGRSHYEVFPETPDRWKEIHRRCLAGDTERCEEDRFPRAGGGVDWVRWEIHPWRNTQDEIGGIIIFTEVITDRKQAKDALRESEESYRVVAETASDCIIKISDQSEILFANLAVQDIFGYTPAELLGQPLTMLMPEYLRHIHRAALKQYIESGTRHMKWSGVELPGLHKSGAEIPLEISFGEFVKDGKHVFTGVVRDITSRKEMEQRLFAQLAITRILAEFSSLSDIAPRVLQALGENLGWSVGAIWTVDRNDRVLRCVETWHGGSQATTEFEACSRESTFKIGVGLPGRVWQAKTASWIPDVTRDSNFPRAPFAVKAGLHAAFGFPLLLGTEVLAVMEFFSPEIHEPDKELLQMLEVIGGQIGQFLERKRLEEQIRQAQKLESIGVLAGGVAHDFNNLLLGVLGNASLALNTLSSTHPSRPFLEDVVRAAESAAHLTRQLLAYAGKGRFLIRPVNLSDLAGELKSLIQTSIPRTVRLRLDLAEDLPPVEGDPGQLQQIIMNLVINGAEAIGEGTIGSVLVVTGIQDTYSWRCRILAVAWITTRSRKSSIRSLRPNSPVGASDLRPCWASFVDTRAPSTCTAHRGRARHSKCSFPQLISRSGKVQT